MSADDHANPSIIVRELVQNSMDASLEAGLSECQVDFVLEEVSTDEIPGIQSYRAALDMAKHAHKNNLEAAEATIERFDQSLKRSSIPVLSVFDNGIGLDPNRMNSLLGDGTSDKTGTSADRGGSFGVGHYTAFPASDLRYVIYGGLSKDGSRCMSGHAVLASHPPPPKYTTKDSFLEAKLRSQNGYYIEDINSVGDPNDSFIFPRDDQVPKFVAERLDRIQRKSASGSVVSILGFNEFRRDKDGSCIGRIFESAASSFFIPILDGKLQVSFEQDDVIHRLNKNKLEQIIRAKQNGKRRSKDSVLRGESVFAALDTFNSGNEHILKTDFGEVRCFFKLANLNESTTILLYRNGMYITDDIPANKPSRYSEFKRFKCVLNVEPDQTTVREPNAFQLIRRAEGEKHLDLEKSRLTSRLKPSFDSLFQQVFEQISRRCTRDDAPMFTPDIFGLEIDPQVQQSQSTMKRSHMSTKSEVDKLDFDETTHAGNGVDPNQDDKPGNGTNSGSGIRKLRGPSIPVEAVARRTGQNVLLQIRSQKKTRNGVLKVDVHGGSDMSCDIPIRDQNARFIVKGCDVEGPSESRNSIALGSMDVGSIREFELEIVEPSDIPAFGVLKIVVVENPSSKASLELT